MIEMIQNADLSILHAIQGAASPALDTFMVGFTTLGEFGALWAIVGAIMIALNKHRTFGIAIFVAIALAFVIGDIGLKNVIERPRPFLVDPVLTTSPVSGRAQPHRRSAGRTARNRMRMHRCLHREYNRIT